MPTKSRAELIAAQERLRAVYPAARAQLMRIPGVLSVGIGMKEVAGTHTDETVFKVTVSAKREPGAIPPAELIPKEILGFKTDVIEHRPEQDEDDDSKHRPLKGGTQVNRDGSNGLGTLGCIATLVSDGSKVLLSNHHVLYGGNGADGTEIGQPTFTRSCCCTCGDVAVNVHGIKRDHLDCAIARLKAGVDADGSIKDVGFITGVADAVAGETVHKRGRTTELTTGKVSNLRMDPGGTRILEIVVKTNDGADRFSRPGDSGSALLNAANEIIGLHSKGDNGEEVTPGNFRSTSIGIQEVLQALSADGFQITIVTGTGGDEALDADESHGPGFGDVMWSIERRLAQSEAGRELWAAVRRNQDEALRLVNHERHVTVAWQRHRGPAFLAALGRSAKEPAYRVPQSIEGVLREQAVAAILAQFERHGSAAMRADLDTFAERLARCLLEHDTLEEMVQAWESAAAELVP